MHHGDQASASFAARTSLWAFQISRRQYSASHRLSPGVTPALDQHRPGAPVRRGPEPQFADAHLLDHEELPEPWDDRGDLIGAHPVIAEEQDDTRSERGVI